MYDAINNHNNNTIYISLHIIMIAIQLCRGDWKKCQAGYGLDLSLLRFMSIYTILELYHAMCNIISLAPDLRDSAWSAAPPIKGYPGHGTSNYFTGREKGCGFLAICYLEVQLYREVRLGPNNLLN